jgi:hypothetical protein
MGRRLLIGAALCLGSTSCALLSQLGTPQGAAVTAVTYNIRHGVGMDDALRLERAAATLRPLDADFIALEEVDRNARRSGSVDQARLLGDLLGMRPAFGAFMDYQGGEHDSRSFEASHLCGPLRSDSPMAMNHGWRCWCR